MLKGTVLEMKHNNYAWLQNFNFNFFKIIIILLFFFFFIVIFFLNSE